MEVGEEPHEEEVTAIISTVDKNGDGQIDYEEFCVMVGGGVGVIGWVETILLCTRQDGIGWGSHTGHLFVMGARALSSQVFAASLVRCRVQHSGQLRHV
jgi:hypothetical protein